MINHPRNSADLCGLFLGNDSSSVLNGMKTRKVGLGGNGHHLAGGVPTLNATVFPHNMEADWLCCTAEVGRVSESRWLKPQRGSTPTTHTECVCVCVTCACVCLQPHLRPTC